MAKWYVRKKKKEKMGAFTKTTITMVIVVVVCTVFAAYQIKNQEDGILDVCATQQDTYVKMVLDQINLKDNRNDEEIINDILSTMDSSSNKYWTFSKETTMLYVKDVIETNRYKGITSVSYYDSEDAKAFFDSIEVNNVSHKKITLNDKDYIASGVSFEYNNNFYKLCLLTNKEVLLNNNNFMAAKVEIVILIGFLLVTLLVTNMLFAREQEYLIATVEEKTRMVDELQGTVGRLNGMLSRKEQCDTRYRFWTKEVIKDFVEKLKSKKIREVSAVKIHCSREKDIKLFFSKSNIVLDKKILRFVFSEKDFLLIFIKHDETHIEECVKLLTSTGVIVDKVEKLDITTLNVDEYLEKWTKEVENEYTNI